MKPILEVRGISKEYLIGVRRDGYLSLRDEIASLLSSTARKERKSKQRFKALSDVSFDVERGTVIGIVGQNGAGKSTLLKILSRITPPSEGRVTVRGRIASLLEVGTGFHAELTGRENIFLNGVILGMSRAEIAERFDEIVAFAEVDRFLDTPVKRYSSGMYVRLAFAVAAHLRPEILIVDEVLAVGDSGFQKKCLGKMSEVASEGRTVILVSHNLSAIQNLCSSAILLEAGKLTSSGPTQEVVELYLRRLFDLGSATELRDRTDRVGDGRVRLQAVRLLDSENNPTTTVQCGSTCAVEFDYAADQPLQSLAIAWNVRDELGQPIFRASSHDTGDDAGDFAAKGTLHCSVPRLPLTPGRYHATVEMRVAGVVADYVQAAFIITVEGGDFFGTGRLTGHSPMQLDHRWRRTNVA